MNLQVWLPKKQQQLVKIAADNGCTICSSLIKLTVDNPQKANLHVLPMQQITVDNLTQYRVRIGPSLPTNPFDRRSESYKTRPILAWRPTGWTYKSVPKDGGKIQQTLTPALPSGITLERSHANIFIHGENFPLDGIFQSIELFSIRMWS